MGVAVRKKHMDAGKTKRHVECERATPISVCVCVCVCVNGCAMDIDGHPVVNARVCLPNHRQIGHIHLRSKCLPIFWLAQCLLWCNGF